MYCIARYVFKSPNSLWVLLPYPNWFFLSFQEWLTDCLTHNFTRRSLRGGQLSFVSVAWFKWQTSLPKIRVSQINPPKQTSRYLIYLANLFLNQSMKRLFRWKQISPPLKLEALIATFWVPETTKRPRCITVSENGSLNVCLRARVALGTILVPRGRAPFGQHQESRPLASLVKSNTGSPRMRFTDFPSLCACSESSLTNLIGSGINLLCLLSHSKTECRWTGPEGAILGADQKVRGLWGRECTGDSLLRRGLRRGSSICYISPLCTAGAKSNGSIRRRTSARPSARCMSISRTSLSFSRTSMDFLALAKFDSLNLTETHC